MVRREVSPNGRIQLTGSRGSFGLWFPTPEVTVMTFSGHCDVPLGDASMDEQTQVMASRSRAVTFIDLEHMTGYDSEVRVRYTRFAQANREHLGFTTEGGCILMRSRLISMGVQVVSLATGRPNNVTSSRSDFERRLAEATGARRTARAVGR